MNHHKKQQCKLKMNLTDLLHVTDSSIWMHALSLHTLYKLSSCSNLFKHWGVVCCQNSPVDLRGIRDLKCLLLFLDLPKPLPKPDGATYLTDEIIQSLVDAGCSQLQSFHFLIFCEITNVGIKTIAQSCKELKSLTVWDCAITDAGIEALAQGCPKLQSLTVLDCGITDTGIEALAQGCPKLQSLDLVGSRSQMLASKLWHRTANFLTLVLT